MLCKRIIARLDVKGPNIVKGIHLEGLRIIGDPKKYASEYYKQGADELIFIDTVASLYERENLRNIVRRTASEVFIPLTVGGGVRTLKDIRALLKSGADKIAMNTAAIRKPEFIKKAAKCFGSQCIVVSIEAKHREGGHWEAYTENGREPSGKDVMEWIELAIEMGAGEILLTSVDKEGTMSGFDWELIKNTSKVCSVPLVVSGGAGNLEDVFKSMKNQNVDGVALASMLHYNKFSISEIKDFLSKNEIHVRF